MKLRSRYLVLTVVAIIVAVLLPAVAYYRWARLEVAQEIIATSVNLMAGEADRAKRELDYAIGRTRNEVLSLAKMPPVEGIGRAIETGGFDAVEQSSLDLWRGRLASIFAASITYGYPKTQLRLIGVADGGRELVRVDQSPTGDSQAVIAPAGALQKQGDRYYFREALALAPGEIYLSQIDLNVEQGKVAQPEMPTLRAATAVRTGRGDVYGCDGLPPVMS